MASEPKSYSLPTESLPGLKHSDHVADLIELKAFLNNRGIVTKNTRIERYIEYFKELPDGDLKEGAPIFKNAADGPFKSAIDWHLYVLREVHELMWILGGFKIHIPKGLDGKLDVLVSGTDFAVLDDKTHSRNVQFELRIASYFCRAGCSVDLTTETDIIAYINDHAFYVECKRVGSLAQLQKRLAEAYKQLGARMPRKPGHPVSYGCIAADVTKAAFSHNGLTFAETNEHSRDIIHNKLVGLANVIKTPDFVCGRRLLPTWLQIHIPSLISHPPTPVTRFSSYFIHSRGINPKGLVALKDLYEISAIGKQCDAREMQPRPLKIREKRSLPTGTCFQIVEKHLLMELLTQAQILGDEKDHSISVAAITINGVKHEFSLDDLKSLIANTPPAKMKAMADNVNHGHIEIVVLMFMRRYPYEESK